MSKSKTPGGLKLGQPGITGYHLLGHPLAAPFASIKEADANLIRSAFGNGMEEVVIRHTLPFIPIPDFATTMDALAAGDAIETGTFQEFGGFLNTPGTSRTTLANTRTPTVGGGALTTPVNAFGASVTQSTDVTQSYDSPTIIEN